MLLWRRSTLAWLTALSPLGCLAKGTEDLALEKRTAKDPTSFSWVKNWAAIGDSFTAGIGSGNLYSTKKSDYECSRYDYSYPVLMNRYLGPSVENFHYKACSGATTQDISKQIDDLPSNLDLAVMTAGGNDLCLASIITTCILNSVTSSKACNNVIDKAQNAIDTILQSNIEDLLTSLDGKMNSDGIITLVSYAQYFDTQTDECTNNQIWVWPFEASAQSLLLNKDRRKKFNTLVENANAKLEAAVESVSSKSNSKIVYTEWDGWPQQADGQFCEPGASPYPNDPSNDDVLFFKLATPKVYNPGTLYRRDGEWRAIEGYGNVTMAGAEEEEGALLGGLDGALVERDPSPPACSKSAFAGWLSDGIGKIFHPNKLGHEAVASFALWFIIDARSSILDVTSPACVPGDSKTCSQKQGSRDYVSADSLYKKYGEFCKDAADAAPDKLAGWSYSKTYYKDTPDEQTFKVEIGPRAGTKFKSSACHDAVKEILDDCDGNDPKNPMNWKFGGTHIDGSFTYHVIPAGKIKRPWPVPKQKIQKCHSSYKFLWNSYEIRGTGWATWDFGQKTLLPAAQKCNAHSVTQWNFEYFDEPDDGGFQWKVTFRTIVFTRARCFSNNNVQHSAGGPGEHGGGCQGNG